MGSPVIDARDTYLVIILIRLAIFLLLKDIIIRDVLVYFPFLTGNVRTAVVLCALSSLNPMH